MEQKEWNLLEKYLSDDELKDIAISEAKSIFNRYYNECKEYVFAQAAKDLMFVEIKEIIKLKKDVVEIKINEVLSGISEFDIQYNGGLNDSIKKCY